MDITANCPLAVTLAERIREARIELTTRWLERITARVAIHPNRVFPTEDLLDHMPLLLLGIADYLEDPSQAIAAEAPVLDKAMELGRLRHAQGFDLYEIQKEYEIFGGIIFAFLARTVDSVDEECTRSELLVCAHRLFHSVSLIQQATTTEYVRLARAQLGEREERLRAFNRTLTHEFRNRIGAALGAGQLLDMPDISDDQRQRLAGVVVRNVDSMRLVLENLLELSRVNLDARQQRHVRLPQVVAEASRQLRDAARSDEVTIRLGDLPDVEVNAAAVELCLTNFISNGIKYANRERVDRWIQVSGRIDSEGDGVLGQVVVEVSDNGLGVPEEQRARLFDRFFRAHEETASHIEGTGLGLSIVRETVESIGGRVWAHFPDEGGSVFCFSVPCRRGEDSRAAAASV